MLPLCCAAQVWFGCNVHGCPLCDWPQRCARTPPDRPPPGASTVHTSSGRPHPSCKHTFTHRSLSSRLCNLPWQCPYGWSQNRSVLQNHFWKHHRWWKASLNSDSYCTLKVADFYIFLEAGSFYQPTRQQSCIYVPSLLQWG